MFFFFSPNGANPIVVTSWILFVHYHERSSNSRAAEVWRIHTHRYGADSSGLGADDTTCGPSPLVDVGVQYELWNLEFREPPLERVNIWVSNSKTLQAPDSSARVNWRPCKPRKTGGMPLRKEQADHLGRLPGARLSADHHHLVAFNQVHYLLWKRRKQKR